MGLSSPPKEQKAKHAKEQQVPDSVRKLPISGSPRPKGTRGKFTVKIRYRQDSKPQS